MSIQIHDLTKKYGAYTALQGINLDIAAGTLVAVLGPSGSGKTTLLRTIAGLETPDTGTIRFHGEDAAALTAGAQQVGFVFQHYALFRHMTVFENVAFGLRVRPRHTRPTAAQIRKRVEELLALVQLSGYANSLPSQLSGGQRQRVALARALAVEPKLLLLDEPFGALDARVRQELRGWLRRLHEEMHITSIFVTHDQEEALEVADQVVVMNAGRIEQVGTPEEVYHHPATPFVYRFLGNVNLFHGRIEAGKVYLGEMALQIPDPAQGGAMAAIASVRPHLLEIRREPGGEASFRARVQHINAAGPQVKVDLVAVWGDFVRVELTQDRYRKLALCQGEMVFVSPKEPGSILVQDAEPQAETEEALMYYI
ncbi:MAG TPA: sulfate ABC transporter ATP-binding protein [Armatimonadota bacterium]|nr:sulfate ABC transporter ATP-binding protein [Armatimonadota bacterium]